MFWMGLDVFCWQKHTVIGDNFQVLLYRYSYKAFVFVPLLWDGFYNLEIHSVLWQTVTLLQLVYAKSRLGLGINWIVCILIRIQFLLIDFYS